MPMAPVFGAGAVFASFSSETKGAVTPPPLLAFERALAEFLAPRGIRLFENEGYTGRSDDVSAVRVTPNIAIIGYPGAFPHFADTPRVHLDDIVHLAKTLVVLTLITQSEEWQRIVLD